MKQAISTERGYNMQNKELYVFLRAMQELHKSKNYDAIGRVLNDGIIELETKTKSQESNNNPEEESE